MGRLAHLLFIALLAAPETASAGRYYSAVNVDASDMLNVRTGVEYGGELKDTKVVGELPANATGIEATGLSVEFEGGLWREIRYKGSPGWVADRFLKSEGMPEIPGNVQCGGTEPFWDFSVEADGARFSTPDDRRNLSITSVRRGVNRIDVWAYRMVGEDRSAVTGLLVYTDRCSDGMSDFNYALEFYLIGIGKDSGPLQGCCTFR